MTVFWLILVLLALIGIGVFYWPYYRESKRVAPNDDWHDLAPGKFAELSGGLTHYTLRGPLKGQTAVCIHGLTTPSGVFEAVAEDLSRMGFRVLTYDLYGRGYSDNAPGDQTLAFHVRQLAELLDALGIDEQVLLVGYSMGGAIATAFAYAYPDKTDRIVFLASAGLDHLVDDKARAARDGGLKGTWMMLAGGARAMASSINAEAGAPTDVEGITDYQLAQLERQGFLTAVLSSLRFALKEDLYATHVALAERRVPVLALWGEFDEVIPSSAKERLAEANPQARQIVLGGAGHGLPYTNSRDIQQAVQTFLKTVI